MITSFIEGRVRFRSAALKDPETMAQVEAAIGALDGVVSLITNVRTGSLLLHYDPKVISKDMLRMAAEALQAQLGENPDNEPEAKNKTGGLALPSLAELLKGRRGELGMLAAALVGTVASPLMGKRLHVLTGLVFLALSAKHTYDRRTLW